MEPKPLFGPCLPSSSPASAGARSSFLLPPSPSDISDDVGATPLFAAPAMGSDSFPPDSSCASFQEAPHEMSYRTPPVPHLKHLLIRCLAPQCLRLLASALPEQGSVPIP